MLGDERLKSQNFTCSTITIKRVEDLLNSDYGKTHYHTKSEFYLAAVKKYLNEQERKISNELFSNANDLFKEG